MKKSEEYQARIKVLLENRPVRPYVEEVQKEINKNPNILIQYHSLTNAMAYIKFLEVIIEEQKKLIDATINEKTTRSKRK